MPGRFRTARSRAVGTRLAVGVAALLLVGCITSYDITLQPQVGDVGVGERRRIDTALYIPDDRRTQVIEAKCPRCGSGINRLPLGQALDSASAQAFGQLFEPLTVVRSRQEAQRHALTIEPRIEHFEHDLIDVMDNRIRGVVVLNVTLYEGDRPIWKRSVRSPESVGTPYHITISAYERSVSTAVSEALSGALKVAVAEIQGEPELAPRLARLEGPVSATAKAPRAAPSDRSLPQTAALGPMRDDLPKTPVTLEYPDGPTQPHDVAVIIGNADYARFGHDIPDVTPAYADAAGFRQYAIRSLGLREGNIIDLRDATHAQMVRVFGSAKNPRGQLWDWVRPDRSRVYVFYSGHGAPAGADGSAYLVPSDADATRIELNGYELETLYRNLSKLPARSVMVVLEACFSGNAQGGSLMTRASPVFVQPKSATVPDNLTVISAGAADQVASWEEDRSHGLFTKYYLTGMSGAADAAPYGNGDGRVSHAELGRYLDDTVTYFARRYYGRDQNSQIVVAD